MDEKLNSENMQKRAADDMHIYLDILQNAPFRSQIFKIFFASGGKGALTPLTKILRTPLMRAIVTIALNDWLTASE